MASKAIQIVSFDIPYPSNYGGVIDVFYKIKALSELGVNVYLHCYYDDRKPSKVLDHLCEQVYYYKREKKLAKVFSTIPFIVSTRSSQRLITTIKSIQAPILFEGLHTTGILLQEEFKSHKTMVRMHNIEHSYYQGLYKSEKHYRKKLYFWLESKKLKHYESILNNVDMVLSISPMEQDYFKTKVNTSIYVPVFHRNSGLVSTNKKGDYVLFHGDLRVADNIKSAEYLIRVFKDLPNYNLVLASSFNNKAVINSIKNHHNINFQVIEDNTSLNTIFENAQMHVILSFQNTGIKLKLINALYQNRHVLANTIVTQGTGLEKICEIFETPDELKEIIKAKYALDFPESELSNREKTLEQFSTERSAKQIIDLL